MFKKNKNKKQLSFQIFRNDQPDCYDDRIIFVAMTST